jgi:S1-C subfamily serine protease
MKLVLTRFAIVVVAGMGLVMGAKAASKPSKAEPIVFHGIDLTPVVAQVKPAVVRVLIADVQGRLGGGGSGSIVSPDGYVYTNWHVAGSSKYVVLTLDSGENVPAKVIGSDIKIDFALLKLQPKVPRVFPYVKIGDSDKVKPGDVVFAMGAPGDTARAVSATQFGEMNPLREFQLVNTVTAGIVRAMEYPVFTLWNAGGDYGTELIKMGYTTATINNGNSGGPAFNVQGEQIGINSWGWSAAEGDNRFMPSNNARKSANDILRYGRVIYPWLGLYAFWGPDDAKSIRVGSGFFGGREVGIEEQSDWAADSWLSKGPLRNALDEFKAPIKLKGVYPGSPAEEAGLAKGDKVISVDEKTYEHAFELMRMIRKMQVGDTVELTIERGERRYIVRVRIAEQPPAPMGAGGTI